MTVEGLVPGDDRDVKVDLSRQEMADAARESYFNGIERLVAGVLAAAGVVNAGELASVEALGGGIRIPSVQEAIAK